MKISFVVSSVMVVLVGCAADGARARTPEIADGNSPTEFQQQRLVGHYSTLDGTSGFIFDRTKAPFMAKLDGGKPMTLTESGGPYQTKEYRTDDHAIWLRVDEEGEVLLFQGPTQHEGVRIVRDADAKPLR